MSEVLHNRIMEETEGRLLCLEVTHPVFAESYTKIYWPELEDRFKKYGEARILFYYPDGDNFPGWEEKAAQIDLDNYTRLGRKITRIALIGAPPRVVQRYETLRPLMGGDVKSFNVDQRDEALAWIKKD